ncbi:hypothetical protein L1887_59937 [Cichorium endivia]|nr:hypothetical protein L1887_59937 [Cichorium endivia]
MPEPSASSATGGARSSWSSSMISECAKPDAILGWYRSSCPSSSSRCVTGDAVLPLAGGGWATARSVSRCSSARFPAHQRAWKKARLEHRHRPPALFARRDRLLTKAKRRVRSRRASRGAARVDAGRQRQDRGPTGRGNVDRESKGRSRVALGRSRIPVQGKPAGAEGTLAPVRDRISVLSARLGISADDPDEHHLDAGYARRTTWPTMRLPIWRPLPGTLPPPCDRTTTTTKTRPRPRRSGVERIGICTSRCSSSPGWARFTTKVDNNPGARSSGTHWRVCTALV